MMHHINYKWEICTATKRMVGDIIFIETYEICLKHYYLPASKSTGQASILSFQSFKLEPRTTTLCVSSPTSALVSKVMPPSKVCVSPRWTYLRALVNVKVIWSLETDAIVHFSLSFWLSCPPVDAMTISSPADQVTGTCSFISVAPVATVSANSVQVTGVGLPVITHIHL